MCKRQGVVIRGEVDHFGAITQLDAGRKVDGLIRFGITDAGHSKGHQAAFGDGDIIHTEAGGVVIRTRTWIERTRTGAIIEDGAHTDRITDAAADAVVAQGHGEGLSTFVNRILGGLHGENLTGHTRAKCQCVADRRKVDQFTGITQLDAGCEVDGL